MMTDFTEFNATVWAGCTTQDYYRKNNKATAAKPLRAMMNIKKVKTVYRALDFFMIV